MASPDEVARIDVLISRVSAQYAAAAERFANDHDGYCSTCRAPAGRNDTGQWWHTGTSCRTSAFAIRHDDGRHRHFLPGVPPEGWKA